MVRIVVNHNLVTVPQPVIAKADVRSNPEVETTKPEARRTATFNPKHMAAPNTAGEVSMFPGMIRW